MKVLIGVWHIYSIAKTETIREFARLLIENYPFADIHAVSGSEAGAVPVPASGEFHCIVETSTVKVGIDSQTASHNPTRMLETFFKENCDVVLCVTLSGSASQTVETFAVEHGYRVIWTSPYQVIPKAEDQRLFTEMNKLKARHLMDLLETMGLLAK